MVRVPYRYFIEPDGEAGLRKLKRRGYPVRRLAVDDGIALTSSRVASDAFRKKSCESMWIDTDQEFDPDAVDHLRSLDAPSRVAPIPGHGRMA